MKTVTSSLSSERDAGVAPATPASITKTGAIRKLHAIADYRLLELGGWPADRESCVAFFKMMRDLGLDEDVPGCEGTTRCTPLGVELEVNLMTVFAGCWELYEIPGILADRGYIDWCQVNETFGLPDPEFEQKIHSLVFRAYRDFCGHSKWLN